MEEKKNAKSSIYFCYNKKCTNKAWRTSCEDEDDDGLISEDHHHDGGGGGGMMMMMSWPPRSYTCSFCKREFRSAQALGGHMNVHRRDRAQLRQLSQQISTTNPTLNLNLNLPPNPNYNILSPLLPKKIRPPPPPPPPPRVVVKPSPPHDFIMRKQFESFRRKNKLVDLKGLADDVKGRGEGEIIRLDLDMNIKEDLDLELRLGYK